MSEVWLLEVLYDGEGSSDDDFQPFLIFASQQAILDHYKNTVEWSLIDSDAMQGRFPGLCHYYASPWPVHGD